MQIQNYRDHLKELDRAQLLNEFDNVLDQLQQVHAGEREAFDWPLDGVARPKWKKWSVGMANPQEAETREVKYRQDGSAYFVERN